MLLSQLIDHLNNKFLEAGRADRLAFFYVSPEKGVSAGSDSDEVIRNIVRQLSHSHSSRELEPAIAQIYRQSASSTEQPPRPMRTDCADMVIDLTHDFPVCIIVDALEVLREGQPSDQTRSSATTSSRVCRIWLIRANIRSRSCSLYLAGLFSGDTPAESIHQSSGR